MRSCLLFCLSCSFIISGSTMAQNVGIGTNNPHPAAKLEVQSSNSGVLIPRLSSAQKISIPSPPAGLMVFDNNKNLFSFYDGSQWTDMKPMATNDSIWDSYMSLAGERIVYNYLGQHVYVGGLPMQPIGSSGSGSIDGALTVQHGSPPPLITNYNLTIDGTGLQARTQAGFINPPVDAKLLLNPFGGNVGMGLTNPNKAKLHVNGYVGNTVAFFSRSSNSQGISMVADWPGVYFNCYFNGGPRSMASSGYAGILNMDQNDGAFIFSLASSANSGADQFISLPEVMRITKEGKVGIGTTNPTYPLSVNGQIQAKEIRVETGWSDYVFDKNYKLRPLKEVEQFIQQHKHLPGIPTAKEIQDKGLPVAEINTKMMEKIEELTLYVIRLENKLKQQQRLLNKQQKQLSALPQISSTIKQ